jgi:hypothetical protein
VSLIWCLRPLGCPCHISSPSSDLILPAPESFEQEVMSAELGLPDIGLTTLTEVASRAREIARVTSLPVLVDAES